MTHEPDRKDLKILAELEKDARQSYGDIAKKVGLSKEVVLYRVKNLEKAGIIKGYIAEVDVYRLGFVYYTLLLRTQEMLAEEESKMINDLKKSDRVAWAVKCEGCWDYNLVLSGRSAGEIAAFFDGFEKKHGKSVLEKSLMQTVTLDYFKRNFGLKEGERVRIRTEAVPMERISVNDERIIGEMSRNARATVKDLAELSSVSPPTVIESIKRMERKRIIQGYHIVSNYAALGQIFYKVWLNLQDMDAEQWQTLYTFLSFEPNVLWATRLIGQYDFSIEIATTPGNFKAFLERFRGRFHRIIKRKEIVTISSEETIRYFGGGGNSGKE